MSRPGESERTGINPFAGPVPARYPRPSRRSPRSPGPRSPGTPRGRPGVRWPGEPPAGLGGFVPPAPRTRAAPGYPGGGWHEPARSASYWWAATLAVVLALAALGFGTWTLACSAEQGKWLTGYGLRYQVPEDWASHPESARPWVAGIRARGVASATEFDCGATRHPRATVGTLLVYPTGQRPGTDQPRLALHDLGLSYASTTYGADAAVTLGPVTPVRVDGVDGVSGVLTVSSGPAAGCRLTGQIAVLALPSTRAGPNGQPTVRMLLLQHDTAGGPRSPAPPAEPEVARILRGVRVGDG